VRARLGHGCLKASTPSTSLPWISSPETGSIIAGSIPKNGSEADPGFVGVTPPSGVMTPRSIQVVCKGFTPAHIQFQYVDKPPKPFRLNGQIHLIWFTAEAYFDTTNTCGTNIIVSSTDSDLEALSHNLAVDSFAPLPDQNKNQDRGSSHAFQGATHTRQTVKRLHCSQYFPSISLHNTLPWSLDWGCGFTVNTFTFNTLFNCCVMLNT